MVTQTSTRAEAPASPLAGLTVRQAMLGLLHCSPDADLRMLAHKMAERSIHCLVVGGVRRAEHGGERLTYGIASDLNLMRGLCEPAGARIASDVATTELITVMPGESLETAARLMVEHGTAHLIVASPQTGLPVGIVSTLDIARAAAGVPRAGEEEFR